MVANDGEKVTPRVNGGSEGGSEKEMKRKR
jgi:predicted chitinase